jgi:hypothetical protein
MHSHEPRLPGSIIDDEFEACFELVLSVVLAKRRMYMVPVRVYLAVPYPGGAKKNNIPGAGYIGKILTRKSSGDHYQTKRRKKGKS